MPTFTTMFMSMNDLSTFSVIAEKQPFDVDVIHGKYVANGKSLLNLISLNLLRTKVEVVLHGDIDQRDAFIRALEAKGIATCVVQ